MTKPYDLILDGQPYLLVPGSYRRSTEGDTGARPGRVTITYFVGGQRRAFQLERDRSWNGAGMRPVLGGQGVEPWPWSDSYTDTTLAATPTGTKLPSLVHTTHTYVANGRYLYRTVSRTASSWGGLTQVADLGAGKVITRLAGYQGKIALCCGTTADVQLYDPGSGAVTTLLAGLKATLGIGYANRLVYADPAAGNEAILRMTTGGGIDSRELDGPIVQLGLHEGKVVIATRSSLWTLDGRSDPVTATWTTDPKPFFTHGVATDEDDFAFLLSFGGKLHTWLAKQVMVWNPTGDRAGWTAAGLEGRAVGGATVAANVLLASITTEAGENQLWAFDGSAWWLVQEGFGQRKFWPMTTGGAGNVDVVFFREGSSSTTYDLYRLVHRDAAVNAYGSTGTWVSSLLDAGDRVSLKAWRRVGAIFATPEDRGNQASIDAVTVTLAVSTDGGRLFVNVASQVMTDPTSRVVEIVAELPAGIYLSRLLQVKVTISGVSDWSPVLVGAWADHGSMPAPTRRKRWSFKVRTDAGQVDMTGSRDVRSVQQTIDDLWAAWASGSPVELVDVDTDVTGTVPLVRVVGLAESRGRLDVPAAEVAVELVEV